MSEEQSDKLRVLTVDDSRVILKAFSKILGNDYDLVAARNGEEAWEILETDDTICAVFTDMEMPNLNGLDLLKLIRGTDDSIIKSLPVILVTSADDTENKVKDAFSLGITDLVRKPFDTLMLQACARAHVKSRYLPTDDEQATVDPATKLANKAYFNDRGEKDMAFAMRHEQSLDVALLGIDNFKALNEAHSDTIVKTLLRKVSSNIRSMIRQEDTLAHLGWDRFGILIQTTDRESTLELLERIRQKIKCKVFNCDGTDITFTFSIGLAIKPPEEERAFKMLVNEATVQLDKAMKAGGDRLITRSLEEIAKAAKKLNKQSDKPLSTAKLDQALKTLGEQPDKLLQQHAKTVVLKLLPILEKCDKYLKLGLESTIKDIQKKLSSD